jgi:AmmeMemoRadiSam system protein B
MTNKIRQPAVAGMFYPAEARRLQQMVKGFLETAVSTPNPILPKALIAPHAGYIYSGPIAGSAYKPLVDDSRLIRRVVLVGPAHTVAIRGLAAVSVDAFATPLGAVKVDGEGVERIQALPQVQINDAAHAQEHGLEVHLPFLQALYQDFAIVPLVVGQVNGVEVAEVLATLWGGVETLIVISSDLSHYYDYETARKLDGATAESIATFQPEKLGPESACGRLPIQGLLLRALAEQLQAHTVDLRNSGDTAGSKDRVVGYGAFLFV